MTIDTWVSLAALLGAMVTIIGTTSGQIRSLRSDVQRDLVRLDGKVDSLRVELKGDIAELRHELKGDLAELRHELKGDLAELRHELKSDVGRLDDRVYALAAGLRPQLEEARSSAASD